MHVVSLRDEHLAALYAVYREATASAAHCRFYPSLSHFGLSLTHPRKPGTRVLVAQDGGEAQGFAALRDQAVTDPAPAETSMTALFVLREEAGQALVEACIGEGRATGKLVAFPAGHWECPIPSYNAGWDGLSDQIKVVARVLARNRFVPYYRELHLECSGSHFPPAVTEIDPSVAVSSRTGEHGEQILAAKAGDEEVGMCGYTTLQSVSDHPEAGTWGYVGWLGVNEAWRRKGIARHLLTRALSDLNARGCAGCWLTTGADNWPAQPLYLALGFEIVDASANFARTL